MSILYIIISLSLIQQSAFANAEDHDEDQASSSSSFIDSYEKGVQSYLTNEFEDCVYYLEQAVDRYRNYYETTANCRIECDYATRDVKNRGDFIHPVNIENLQFYELILKRTLCLTNCRKRNFKSLPFEEDFEGYYMDLFKNRRAYAYLHSCYTKTDQITEAASAALTYMVKHPGDTVMQKNFENSIETPGVNKTEIVDMEEKKFVELFVAGILALNDKNWENAVSFMESSVMQYIFDENQCRAYCEGEFDHGFLPDFISAIGNHFTNALYCKKNCSMEMGQVRGKFYENMFAAHYKYLQMAYYEVKKYEESYRTGLSYLLFDKHNEDMHNNLKLISKEHKGLLGKDAFKDRREAAEYRERQLYEEKLIAFIKREFESTSSDIESNEEEYLNRKPIGEEELYSVNSSDDDNQRESEIDPATIEEGTIYQTPNRGYHEEF